ncbi:MAG: hypothetical protein COA77_04230 [Thaumarchaeota archaeon]|nr:MAG: hypothetical protein COA77_04230 [Nitrososphaerota archaeon]
MSTEFNLLYEINEKLSRIEKKLNIVPDLDITITDFDDSIGQFKYFAKNGLKLEQITITSYSQIILKFLNHSKGIINPDTVKQFFDSNTSDSSKSNYLKALRKYTRDFLKLGNWIEDFKFENNSKLKIKNIPTDYQLVQFYNLLPNVQTKLIFLFLHNSGLRIGEILKLKVKNVSTISNSIDATNIHEGETKHSWISFITVQTMTHFEDHIIDNFDEDDPKHSELLLFSVPKRTLQQAFKDASEQLGFHINPHLLRTVFADRCTKAGIKDKYIDAFCGRISQGILAKHYTAYSEDALYDEYQKVESLLNLEI